MIEELQAVLKKFHAFQIDHAENGRPPYSYDTIGLSEWLEFDEGITDKISTTEKSVPVNDRDDEQLHWVEGDKNGKQINILHWAGCEGKCEAYLYLEQHRDLDIRQGRDYTLKKVNGTWVLKEMENGKNKTAKKAEAASSPLQETE